MQAEEATNGNGHHKGVLVVDDARIEDLLRMRLPDSVSLRGVQTTNESEGIDVDVVVIGGEFPLMELTQVRVHPKLETTPVILVAPGRPFAKLDMTSLGVEIVSNGNVVKELDHILNRMLNLNGH